MLAIGLVTALLNFRPAEASEHIHRRLTISDGHAMCANEDKTAIGWFVVGAVEIAQFLAGVQSADHRFCVHPSTPPSNLVATVCSHLSTVTDEAANSYLGQPILMNEVIYSLSMAYPHPSTRVFPCWREQ